MGWHAHTHIYTNLKCSNVCIVTGFTMIKPHDEIENRDEKKIVVSFQNKIENEREHFFLTIWILFLKLKKRWTYYELCM